MYQDRMWIAGYQGETSPIRKKEVNSEKTLQVAGRPSRRHISLLQRFHWQCYVTKKVAIAISQIARDLYILLELRPHKRK